MTVAFLYPGVWLAALAVGVPLWLHLRRRRETDVVRFSALRFLEDQGTAHRSPLHLDDLPLFALRALGVLLLVSAFAWPYFPNRVGAVSSESRVYVLDNTLSHQANHGFTRDRKDLAKQIEGAPPGVQVAVVELRSHPRVVATFTDSRETTAEQVRTLAPSFERGSYLAALRQAETLLTNTLCESKRIHLVTDNQQNQWTEVLDSPPFLKGLDLVLPKARTVPVPDLAVCRPQLQRTFAGDKAIVDFGVELRHQGGVKTAQLTLRVNGRQIVSNSLDLRDKPESLLATARWEADPAKWISGDVRVVGSPDALDADNQAFFSLPPVREGQVLLLAQSPFLRAALSPVVMKGYWATRSVELGREEAEVSRPELADVLCAETSYLRSQVTRSLVLRYLESGRGVLLVLEEDSPIVKGFLEEFGLKPATSTGQVTGSTKFQYVFTDHPALRPFRSPDMGNLREVEVYRYRRLGAGKAVPLIVSESGDPLFLQATTAKGKLFVCAFGMGRRDTNWPIHPTFLPFLDLCLQNARGEDEVPVGFESGERCALELPGWRPGRTFVLRAGRREILKGTAEKSRIEFTAPSEPGLYSLAWEGDPSTQRILSVNPSPLESELTYLKSAQPVRSWLARSPSGPEAAQRAMPLLKLTRLEILRQRIWWFLLVGGLALLVSETVWLAARRERS